MICIFRVIFTCAIFLSSFEYLTASTKEDSQLSISIRALQKQINSLQGEISDLESQQKKEASFSTYSSKVVNNQKNNFNYDDFANNAIGMSKTIDLDDEKISLKEQALEGIFNNNQGVNVSEAPVVTSQGQVAFIGSYSGNNSIPIGQISSSLFASTVIGHRDNFGQQEVFFGGLVSLNAQTWFGDDQKRVNFENESISDFSGAGQNIYLMDAALHILASLGDYVTLSYDISSGEEEEFSLNNAFAIFGNPAVTPFFVTVGRSQLTVSTFGGGGPSTASIANFLSVGKATNVSLNYKTQTLNASLAVFGSNDRKADFSAGLFYADSWTEDVALGFNMGYVYNINGADNQNISMIAAEKTIGVYNIDTTIAYKIGGGALQFNTGWATSTSAFDFNGVGKDVFAGVWYTAANYSSILGGRSTNFGLSYGQTYNAAAIPMSIAGNPIQDGLSKYGIEKQLTFSTQRSYFDDDVIFGPEWAYQMFYNGDSMNTLSLEVSVYL